MLHEESRKIEKETWEKLGGNFIHSFKTKTGDIDFTHADFTIPDIKALNGIMARIHQIAVRKAVNGKPRKIAIHCHGGTGRTGWVIAVMKRSLSPINGMTWEELTEEVGRDYKAKAQEDLEESIERPKVIAARREQLDSI